MNKIKVITVISALVISSSTFAATSSEEEALARAYGNEEFISIATGQSQPISQAPAVASVITADEIKKMAATDLDQVLESVPGLHVSVAPRGYLPLYTMRGIYSENNPQVLVLINDIPITNLYVGNRGELWGGMPVNNIQRIEVIRGPGSSVYGADAFAGTINIITKKADDINGTEVGGRVGSFNTREGWLLHGGKWRSFDIAFSLELKKSDGQDKVIDADAQSGIDNLFGTSASLAPGPVNLERNNLDTRIDISNDAWRLRLGYQGRHDGGTGAGIALALDPQGTGNSDRYNADLTYTNAVSHFWDITGQASFYDVSNEPDLVLYPPGAVLSPLVDITVNPPLPLSLFPNGMIARPYVYERHTRLNLSAFYHGIDDHNIRLGVGTVHSDMYKIKELKNYTFDPVTGFPIYLGSIVDASNNSSLVFIRPHDRDINYLFVQDEWAMAPDWTLTGGIRYDEYSDFGNTTNPRLALVWQTRYNLTSKLLYGRAFRAPAFNELYNNNNPIAQGNRDLKPENIDTYEMAFNYQYSEKLSTNLNIFRYRMSDILRFVAPTFTAENSGVIHGHGLEFELRYQVDSQLQVAGNYAYQNSSEKDTHSDVANAPQHQVYVNTNWKPFQEWLLSAQLNWVADRKRDVLDPRPQMDDYILVDLSLRYQPLSGSWEVALAGHNIFDTDAFEPSPRLDPFNQPLIPNDLPLAGRNIFVEGRVYFDH